MWKRGISLGLILAFSQIASVAVARAEDAPTLLASVKAATGGDAWNNIRSLRIRGKEIAGGMTRSREEWDDVRTGRYVVHAQSVFGTQGAGFDGVSPWIQIYGGLSYTFGDEDAQLGATNAAYQVSLAYWFPERRPATMQDDGIQQEEGRTFEVVTITPEGGRPFSFWVDRATHLIDRVVEQEAEKVSVTRYSDYRKVEGVKFPFTIRRGRLDSDDWDVETVESVTVNPLLSDDEFALPALPAPDFEVEHGKSSTTVPFRVENNIVLVPVRLNGQGPYWADFDSGSGLVLQPAVASQLKLEDVYQHKAYGGGEGSVISGRAIVETLEIGDVRLTRQPASVFGFYEDKPEMILVGSEILQRFAVHLDFDKMLLTLTPLDRFIYQGAGSIVPFHFQDNQPEVYGAVDGIAGAFAIDTGDNGSLLLIAPFATRYGLYERYHATIPYGGKAVGDTHGVMARVGRVSLFGADGRAVLEVMKPLTYLSQQKGGFDANRYVSGNIGLGILKQFNLTFDYRRQQIIFEKNHLYGADDPYNRTGLHLKREGKNWVVNELDSSSPAIAAGIKIGDVVLSVDGQDTTEMKLEALNDLFRQPVGTTLSLVIGSGENRRPVKLVLKDLVQI
ncbi:MAG: aspartyl protease family protein [Terriglobales bacterium]